MVKYMQIKRKRYKHTMQKEKQLNKENSCIIIV